MAQALSQEHCLSCISSFLEIQSASLTLPKREPSAAFGSLDAVDAQPVRPFHLLQVFGIELVANGVEELDTIIRMESRIPTTEHCCAGATIHELLCGNAMPGELPTPAT